MRRHLLLPLLLLLAAASNAEQPAPQTKPHWTARHERILADLRTAAPQIIFIGDSIVQELENASPGFGDINQVWRRFYACHHALNLGFAGDTTGNVLWRLQNGEVAGIHPKLAVILIGTNDISPRGGATPEDAANGIRAVVAELHDRLPTTRILLLGLLPRERFERSRAAVNQRLEAMDWASLGTHYVEVDHTLEDGGVAADTLYREAAIGRPLLHPNAAGWQKIASAIEPDVAAAIGGGVCEVGK
jgi:lysophospholipase L1-like esterase